MFPVSTLIDVRLEQSSNTLSPMFVTESGMLTKVSPSQLWNAHFPILVTELDMLMDLSPEQ